MAEGVGRLGLLRCLVLGRPECRRVAEILGDGVLNFDLVVEVFQREVVDRPQAADHDVEGGDGR